ncbi:MAG: peptide chain release factor N(5)-glutamine methyltransferase [Anaerolineae bacterium]
MRRRQAFRTCGDDSLPREYALGSVLQEGFDRLRHVTDMPRLEAEVLLSSVAGLSRAALLAHPERCLRPDQMERYGEKVALRAEGHPLPYLVGQVEFYGLEFSVTPDVLIPRPETETLVDLALARRPGAVVDVGTGSGCIAVALAVHLPGAQIYATDLSASALRVAAVNARRHGVADRIRLIQCDLVGGLRGPVDLVVSNPPYVAISEWASLPRSVRCYEPRLALDGGRDGLEVVRRLLACAPGVLGRAEPAPSLGLWRGEGTLLMELGASGGGAVSLASSLLPGARIAVHPDLAGRDRVLEVVPRTLPR